MPSDRQPKQSHARMGEESDLSLEVIILIVFGVFWLLFGLLLIKIYTEMPYSQDSAFGLFLVIVSFQMITMGKTPFGDLRRSWALVIIGIGTAILGIAACLVRLLHNICPHACWNSPVCWRYSSFYAALPF